MNNELLNLGERTLNYYHNNEHLKDVVKPSIPIMYFGDYSAYEKSKLKIITVGLNPSNMEFQESDKTGLSYFRFPKWESTSDYLGALNNYFETGKSYDNWFDRSFENVLNGIETSFYSKKQKTNRALHTDIFSTIATNPTWTKLSQETKKELITEGHEIWRKLVEILNPDIIIAALSKKDCSYIELKNIEELMKITLTKDGNLRKRPYSIKKALFNDKVIILGRTVNVPFGDIAHELKPEIGKLILSNA